MSARRTEQGSAAKPIAWRWEWPGSDIFGVVTDKPPSIPGLKLTPLYETFAAREIEAVAPPLGDTHEG